MTIQRCDKCGNIIGFCLCAVREREAYETVDYNAGASLLRRVLDHAVKNEGLSFTDALDTTE